MTELIRCGDVLLVPVIRRGSSAVFPRTISLHSIDGPIHLLCGSRSRWHGCHGVPRFRQQPRWRTPEPRHERPRDARRRRGAHAPDRWHVAHPPDRPVTRCRTRRPASFGWLEVEHMVVALAACVVQFPRRVRRHGINRGAARRPRSRTADCGSRRNRLRGVRSAAALQLTLPIRIPARADTRISAHVGRAGSDRIRCQWQWIDFAGTGRRSSTSARHPTD